MLSASQACPGCPNTILPASRMGPSLGNQRLLVCSGGVDFCSQLWVAAKTPGGGGSAWTLVKALRSQPHSGRLGTSREPSPGREVWRQCPAVSHHSRAEAPPAPWRCPASAPPSPSPCRTTGLLAVESEDGDCSSREEPSAGPLLRAQGGAGGPKQPRTLGWPGTRIISFPTGSLGGRRSGHSPPAGSGPALPRPTHLPPDSCPQNGQGKETLQVPTRLGTCEQRP